MWIKLEKEHQKYFEIILSLVCLVFLQSIFYNYFIYDDTFHQDRSLELNSLKALLETKIPVFYLSLKFINLFGSETPFYFRLFNIALHALNAILIFLCTAKLIEIAFHKKITSAAFIASLLFALHPIQVESVVWISSLKGTLAHFFSLCALFIYLQKDVEFKLRSALVFLLYVLSVLSKTSNILIPLLFVLIEIFFYNATLTTIIRKNYLLLVLGFFLGILNILEYPQLSPLLKEFKWAERTINSLYIITFYIKKYFWPHPLVFDYSITTTFFQTELKTDVYFLRKIFFHAFIFFVLFFRMHFSPRFYLSAFGFWVYLIFIFPVLGFIPHNFEGISLVADRFFYSGNWGVTLVLLGLILPYYEKLEKFLKWPVCCCVFVGVVLSFYQVVLWRNSTTFLEHSLNYNPKSLPVLEALASASMKEHDYKRAIEIAGQGLRQANSFTFYKVMVSSLAAQRSYNLIEVFEKSMLMEKKINDLKVKALLDFYLFRFDQLSKRLDEVDDEALLKVIMRIRFPEEAQVQALGNKLETKAYIQDLINRYPEERDKEVMESYFYTAQYFVGLGLCQEFMYFKKQMDEYRSKRNYQGSINLEYDAIKCKSILDKAKKIVEISDNKKIKK